VLTIIYIYMKLYLERNDERKRKDKNLSWVEVAIPSSKHTVMNIMINSTVNRIVIQIVVLKLNITLIMYIRDS